MPLKTLKQCLKEAQTLLQPPNALPTSPADLTKRLGIDSTSTHTRAELELLVGERCLGLLERIQAWLQKEYWPVEHRDGLGPSDFLLGTADQRLIRSLCSQTIDSLLLPLSIKFQETDVENTEELQTQLSDIIHTLLLGMMRTSPPPTPSAGPSSRPNFPLTAVGQVMILKHLPYIYISATLLVYDPRLPKTVHDRLRGYLIMQPLPSTFMISAMGTAIQLSKSRKEEAGTEGWRRNWPTHVSNRLGFQMSAVIRRPGGSRAIMENIFGENAVLQGGRGVDTDKLDAIARAIIAAPGNLPTSDWIPRTLRDLIGLIVPGTGTTNPLLFINAACYTIYRIWSLHTKEATTHLDEELQTPLSAYKEYRKTGSMEPANAPSEMQRAITCISALLTHTPFSPEFLDYLIGQNLSILIWLRQYLFDPDAPIEISTSTTSSPGSDAGSTSATRGSPGQDAKGFGSTLSKTIHQILLSWARDVGLEDGVRRISQAAEVDGFKLNMIIAEAERSDLANAIALESSGQVAERGKGEKYEKDPQTEALTGMIQDKLNL